MDNLNNAKKYLMKTKKAYPSEKTFNYLEHPVALAYLDVREQDINYSYIVHKENKRLYEDEFIQTCNDFFEVASIPENIKFLDNKFFRQFDDGMIEGINKLDVESLREYDEDGYDILEIKEPITFEGLRKSYRKAAMEYHPDHGGSHDKMVAINSAFELFHHIISIKDIYETHMTVPVTKEDENS
jgi:hypothetical protein